MVVVCGGPALPSDTGLEAGSQHAALGLADTKNWTGKDRMEQRTFRSVRGSTINATGGGETHRRTRGNRNTLIVANCVQNRRQKQRKVGACSVMVAP